jgi:hypothetical protein
MGGLVFRVGDYQVVEMDYAYEVPEEGADSAEYYDTLVASITVEKLRSDSTGKEFNIPVSELWHIVKCEDGRYWPSWSLGKEEDGKTPRDWLFNKLAEAEIKVVITPRLNIHCSNQDNYKTIPGYYLSTDIYDDDIVVKTTPKEYLITDLKELEWLGSKGFGYSW